MGAKEIVDLLKSLLKENRINKQQFRTYRGQVLSGNVSACIVGMKRKHLISDEFEREMCQKETMAYTE